jgi:ABC-type polysaccharide/polyol phosphate export permease
MFLVIFTSLLGNYTVHIGTRSVSSATYYVASMASFAVITACYNNIAIQTTFQRDAGVLKRTNGTPLPSGSFLGARVVHALFIAVILVVITAAFGYVFYNSDIPTGLTLLRFAVVLVVGAASFCALGLATTAAIPNAEASAAIVNAIILPLLFLSGIFHPVREQHPGLDPLDRPDLPGQALRRRDAGRVPRHGLPLDRRAGGRGLGTGRAGPGHALLQLGTPPGVTLASPPCCATVDN